MDVGLLILLNLLTAPIFFEIEELGNQQKRFPRFLEILKFQKTRGSRWIKLFIVLVFLLFIISIAPTASGKTYSAGFGLILTVVLIQIVAWMLLVARIKKLKQDF